MRRVRVTIQSGIVDKKEYDIEYEAFEDFKTALLKRFGNFIGTNNANKNKDRVKNMIRKSHSYAEIERGAWGTGWDITIWELE